MFVRLSDRGARGLRRHARDVAPEVPIETGGRLLKLADVAQVRGGLEDPPQFTVRHNGQPVLLCWA